MYLLYVGTIADTIAIAETRCIKSKKNDQAASCIFYVKNIYLGALIFTIIVIIVIFTFT